MPGNNLINLFFSGIFVSHLYILQRLIYLKVENVTCVSLSGTTYNLQGGMKCSKHMERVPRHPSAC